METPIKVGLVYGSTRPGRFCDTVARWAAGQIAAREGFAVEIIDPAAVEIAGTGSLNARIAACDAFIVVTPEYNHGYPAPLKALIASIGSEWHAKPVAFISYGGVSGGLRAVEQLRLVFAELHAAPSATASASPVRGNSSMPTAHYAARSAPSDPWMRCSAVCTGGPSASPMPATSGLTRKLFRRSACFG